MLKSVVKAISLWIILAAICFGTTGLLAVGVVHADTQADLAEYEYNETGNTSQAIYNKEVAAQTFTTALTHEVSYIALYGYITGDPTYILVQLQTANSTIIANAIPTGDLVYHWFGSKSEAEKTSVYFTGNESGSWVMFQLQHGAKLEGNTTYAIVVKAPAGDSVNSFSWGYQDGGDVYAEGSAITSTNGGSTWSAPGDDDFMFQTWGECGVAFQSVNVYNSFYEPGDWLIVCSYINKAPTYYKDDDIEQHFRLQLLDNTNSEVAGETVLRSWDASVASIYLNPSQVTSLEWETGNFTLRMLATYGGGWYIDHGLVPAEFVGDTLTFLDKWCLSQAQWMGTINHGDDMYYLRGTPVGLILTAGNGKDDSGIALFDLGIPRLGSIRGQYIYETYMDEATLNPMGPPNPVLQNRYSWQLQLGPDLVAILDDLGSPFHLSGKVIGLIVMLALYVFVVGGSLPAGHGTAGAAAGFIIVLIGMIAGLVEVVWVIIALVIALMLFLRRLVIQGA